MNPLLLAELRDRKPNRSDYTSDEAYRVALVKQSVIDKVAAERVNERDPDDPEQGYYVNPDKARELHSRRFRSVFTPTERKIEDYPKTKNADGVSIVCHFDMIHGTDLDEFKNEIHSLREAGIVVVNTEHLLDQGAIRKLAGFGRKDESYDRLWSQLMRSAMKKRIFSAKQGHQDLVFLGPLDWYARPGVVLNTKGVVQLYLYLYQTRDDAWDIVFTQRQSDPLYWTRPENGSRHFDAERDPKGEQFAFSLWAFAQTVHRSNDFYRPSSVNGIKQHLKDAHKNTPVAHGARKKELMAMLNDYDEDEIDRDEAEFHRIPNIQSSTTQLQKSYTTRAQPNNQFNARKFVEEWDDYKSEDDDEEF